jgi:hypothetical protein
MTMVANGRPDRKRRNAHGCADPRDSTGILVTIAASIFIILNP